MTSIAGIRLKKNREKSVLQYHPWIFSGAIQEIDHGIGDGDMAAVSDFSGEHLGYGYYNSKTQISVRMLSFSTDPVDDGFFRRLIISAIEKRKAGPSLGRTTACRMVFSEGDFLPGLIVDRYNNHLVIQIFTLGMEKMKGSIVRMLEKTLHPESVYERSDHEGRKLEGLPESSGQLAGTTPEEITINENGASFNVDVMRGQKTGFFLDQRDNRMLVRSLSKDRKALNLFSYTGGFSVQALAGGATGAVCVDASESALTAAHANAVLNGYGGKHETVRADIFQYLRHADIDAGIIVCDPPALVKSKNALDAGCRGYKDLNLQITKKCRPGTLLLTCSCSRFVSMDLFQKIVFSAFADAGRKASIIGKFGHPADHPVSIFCPETEYLKSMLLYIE
ncbi:MAG TPA: class I SAM-dependent rRNA methyltransferase [Spirochaetota bacterium]|nr:class I SAM-dependent rRNA methyltransferase [Spirochaetota bacterium]HSA15296.1 class I SAM-dependent rRNA methyltransferase [Spirochaetota bacterium]